MKIAVATIASLMLSFPAFADDGADYVRLLSRSSISLMGAADQAAYTLQGRAIAAEVRSKNGVPVFHVKVATMSDIYQVKINGISGAIVDIDD